MFYDLIKNLKIMDSLIFSSKNHYLAIVPILFHIEFLFIDPFIFTFNFFRKTDKEKGEEPDNRIKDTVIHFLSDFLHKNDNSVVTICETIDKKELARHKLFHKWFEELEIKQVKKIDREIELD